MGKSCPYEGQGWENQLLLKESVLKVEQEFYNKIREVIPIVSVDIIAIYKGKVLLVKRKNIPAKGLWWFPGGGIRKWESPENTVRRELKEETGLDIVSTKFLTVMDCPFQEDNLHCIALVFKAMISSDRVVLDDESSDYRWLDLGDYQGRFELHPYLKKELGIFSNTRKGN